MKYDHNSNSLWMEILLRWQYQTNINNYGRISYSIIIIYNQYPRSILIPLHSNCQLFILIYVQEEKSQIHYPSQRSIYSNIIALLKWQCSCFVAEYAINLDITIPYGYRVSHSKIEQTLAVNFSFLTFGMVKTSRHLEKKWKTFVTSYSYTKQQKRYQVNNFEYIFLYINFSDALYYIPIL